MEFEVLRTLGDSNPSKALTNHVDKEDKLNNESLSSWGHRIDDPWRETENGYHQRIRSVFLDPVQ